MYRDCKARAEPKRAFDMMGIAQAQALGPEGSGKRAETGESCGGQQWTSDHRLLESQVRRISGERILVLRYGVELYCLISVVESQDVNYVQTHLEARLGISLATGVGGTGFKHS